MPQKGKKFKCLKALKLEKPKKMAVGLPTTIQGLRQAMFGVTTSVWSA
jgi:hypothetical protein